MKNNLAKFLLILGVLVLFFIQKKCSDLKIEKFQTEINKQVLKNDTLKQINDTQYEKLVADTLTIKELKKEISKIGIKVKNPKIIFDTQYKQRDIEKNIDSVKVKSNTLDIIDYYPNRESYTLQYESTIDLNTKKGKSKFTFKPQNLDIVVSETEGGLWKANFKTDSEYVTIDKVDVKSLPSVTKETKIDNFKYLTGIKYNTNLSGDKNSFEVIGGIRYKRVGILGSVNSDKQLGIGTILEW